MNRLPIKWREPSGRGHWYDYWSNFCNGAPNLLRTNDVRRLETEWNGRLNDVRPHDDPPYIEFKTP